MPVVRQRPKGSNPPCSCSQRSRGRDADTTSAVFKVCAGPQAQSFLQISGAEDGQNIKNMGKSVDYEGKPLETVLLHIYDGQPHPSTGNPLYDSSTYTKIDDHNIFWSRSKNGKQVMVGYMVMAPDGKSYATTVISTTGKGGIDTTVVEKQ